MPESGRTPVPSRNEDQPVWYVYLLECADGTLYCGVTTDPARRLAEHNGERPGGAKYTTGRRPVRMLAAVEQRDRAAACRLERLVKTIPRKAKMALLLAAGKPSKQPYPTRRAAPSDNDVDGGETMLRNDFTRCFHRGGGTGPEEILSGKSTRG